MGAYTSIQGLYGFPGTPSIQVVPTLGPKVYI